jgi:hypothetical protein
VGIEFADDGGGQKMTRASRWNGHSREGGNPDLARHTFDTTLGYKPYLLRANTSFMPFIDFVHKTCPSPLSAGVSAFSWMRSVWIPAFEGMTRTEALA